MTTEQFIKKYNLTKDSVPKLYEVYLDLISRKEIEDAFKLSLIINFLDVDKILNK